MSGKFGRLAALLPLLTARLREGEAQLSDEQGSVVAQLLLLRADIQLRLRHAQVPPLELLHLDAALGELETAFRSASRDDERPGLADIRDVVVPIALAAEHRARPPVLTPAQTLRRKSIANAIGFALPFLLTVASAPFSLSYAGNVITPDGRTQTNIAVTGNTTDITTNTVQNGTGYNSFTQFQVGQGNTVNMQVPNQAQQLMNVVTQSPISIDGTLNAYKNGQIGGNVYFADPYGFVVGSQGAVNVGSLTVRTPTQAVTNEVLDQNGNADQTTTANIMSGNIPISPDGSVSIQGHINAPGGVHITAQSVNTTAQTASNSSDSQAQAFSSSVNTQGLQQGAQITASNGNIDITTAGDANIGGTISANGAASQNAGSVTIAAGGNANLDSTANITAKGVGAASNGGAVSIKAGDDLNVAAGAVVDVSAGTSGNGGTIELSAVGSANFTQATLNAGATSGQAGSITIDPAVVIIGSAVDVPTNDAPVNGSINSNGGSVTITASNSITIETNAYIVSGGGTVTLNADPQAGTGTITMQTGSYIDSNGGAVSLTAGQSISMLGTSVINTRQTVAAGGTPNAPNDVTTAPLGNSGAVSFSAPSITIDGTVETQALNNLGGTPSADGDITLTAEDDATASFGTFTETTGTNISVAGTLAGGTIDVSATTDSDSGTSYEGSYSGSSGIDISGTITGGTIDIESHSTASSDLPLLSIGQVTSDFTYAAVGADVGYEDAEPSSTITIDSSAVIHGSGNVTVNSETDATAANYSLAAGADQATVLSSLAGTLGSTVLPAVVVGIVKSNASTTVASNATISSGGTLAVRAYNNDELDISEITITNSTTPEVDVSLAYSKATVTSNADVAPGAKISAQNVDVVAHNDNSWATETTVYAFGTGEAGFAASISDGNDSSATAKYEPSFSGTNLTVEADSLTSDDKVDSSATVGNPDLLGLVIKGMSEAAGALSFVQSESSGADSSAESGDSQNTQDFKMGAALSLTLDDTQGATALLGSTPATAGTLPVDISASGNVAVIANTTDTPGSTAEAETHSPEEKDADPDNPDALVSVSAGIAIAQRNLSANAQVASDTDISAVNIGVNANTATSTLTDAINDWEDGTSVRDIISDINGTGGAADKIFTSFAEGAGEAENDGFAGAADYFSLDDNTTAFVGNGATLTATGSSSSAQPWSVINDNGDTQSFDSPIDVEADRALESLNFGGNISLLLDGLSAKGLGGIGEDSNSFGAAVTIVAYSGNTIAGIGSDATVTDNGALTVAANADDKAITISPADGSEGNSAADIMYAQFSDGGLLGTSTNVHSSIAASDDISATSVDLEANQGENVGTVSGSLQTGSKTSVGGLISYNEVAPSVKAYVGNNSDSLDDPSAALPAGFVAPATPGITGTGLGSSVDIKATEGGTLQSLAADIEAGENNALGVAAPVNTIDDTVSAAIDGANVSAINVFVSANTSDSITTLAVGASKSSKDGAAGAGSLSIANIEPTVSSTIDDGSNVTGEDNVGVTAENDDSITTIAGEFAVGEGGEGLGLSIVVNNITGSTTAAITGSNTTVNANGCNYGSAIADVTTSAGTTLSTSCSRSSSQQFPADQFSVNSGTLKSQPTIGISSIAQPTVDLSENPVMLTGLAVDATAHQAIVADTATLGLSTGGGSAGAVNTVTSNIDATATAEINKAHIDTDLDTTADPGKTGYAAPQIDVIAGNQTYTADFVLGIAVSTKGDGGAGAASVATFDGTTTADVTNATIGTQLAGNPLVGDLDVYAGSTQAESVIVLAGAGSRGSSLALSLAVTKFSADTEAYVSGGSIDAPSLDDAADSSNGAYILAGAGAVSGAGAGGGGSVAVTINDDTTLAYVGDRTDELDGGTVDPTALTVGALAVDATTTDDFTSLLIGAAGGGDTGIAAIADVTLMSNTTDAGLYGADVDQGSTPASSVSVAAEDNDTIDATSGGGGVGGTAGVGAAANVIVLHSSVTGTILNSNVASSGAVDVSSEGDKDIDAETVVVGAGGTAGISGAVGVVLAGTDATSDVQGQLGHGSNGGTLGAVNADAPGMGVTNAADSGSPDTITASVGGGSLSAGGGLSIAATGHTTTSNTAIGVAGGGGAGIGGSVAYTDVGDTVDATLDNASAVAPSVSVSAQAADGSGHAIYTEADAGGAGGVGLGAGVAIGTLSDNVEASLDGSATGDNTGALSITAGDSTSVESKGVGVAVGGVAVGVMVAMASKDSTVDAQTVTQVRNPAVALPASISDYGTVDVTASDGGAVSSTALAAAGGVGVAGSGAAATSSDDAVVDATLAGNTTISGANTLTDVAASDTPDVTSTAEGAALSASAALGVSVAESDVDPTVHATLGNDVDISGAGGLIVSATLAPDPSQGTDASAQAYTGSGGIDLALNGAIAFATNTSDVEATTGTSDTVPDGDLSVIASNTSNQSADAFGVSIGGLAGGASYADACSGGATTADNTCTGQNNTIATLGSATDPTHSGSLTVQAIGNDTDTSQATAGTYGLVAGNASISTTSDGANVAATVDGTMIAATDVAVDATHQDNYQENANSSEVSALGASGADAEHDANSTVTATLGDGTIIAASGSIDIGAENDFTELSGEDAADAGGGGALNAAAALSSTTISGATNVDIGNSVVLSAGTDPILNPGSITIVADSSVNAADVVTISTGGALEGSGIQNSFDAETDNTVSMGSNDVFLAFGNFNAGTFTDDNVTAEALAHTWGILGAVADAESSTSLTSNQTVTLGQGSTVETYGNANITAGQDPATAQGSAMLDSAQAETYVSGFVAVPLASASSSATDNTSLTIAQGAVVNAGENATIGSYAGSLNPADDAEGHGYEVGFIPVKDGDASTPVSNETEDVEIDGAITAGAFNNLDITIADCGDVTGGYCDGKGITVSGNPFTDATAISPLFMFADNFNPIDFINERVQGADAAELVSTVSSGTVSAISLGTLFASPGVVTVNASQLTGTGSLTANGGANITVNNASPDYLIVNATEIPNIPGGSVFFTGAAASAPAGMTVTQNTPGAPSIISIDDSYALTGPAPSSVVFVNGEIEDLGGQVTIEDDLGSLGQFAPIEAQNVVLKVPQGVLVVDLSPGILETTGPSVEADWEPFMVFPGGDPSQGTPNADLAFAYAVNAVFNPANASGQQLFGSIDAPPFVTLFNDALDNGGTLTGIANVNETNFYTDGKGSDGQAFLAYGTCYPDFHSSNNCSAASNQQYSPVNQVWNSNWSDLSRQIALVPIEQLDYSSNATPAAGTAPTSVSAIVANTISITASYIDVDSDVTAGPPTNWSVDLPSDVSNTITADQKSFVSGGAKTYDLSCTAQVTTDCATTVGADDSLITATYNAQTQQITVNNVLASASEAASIVLDGAIMSTNTLGHIHVNAGLGQVTIDNQTGTPIEVNDVVTGSANRPGGVSGAIEIIDTEKEAMDPNAPFNFWYEFTPGQGVTTYQSEDPNPSLSPFTPDADATALPASSSTDFEYHPVAGLVWTWQEMAFLARTVTIPSSSDANNAHTNPTTSDWFFTDPTGTPLGNNDNNPWYFVNNVNTSGIAYTPGSTFAAFDPFTGSFLPSPSQPTYLTQDPALAGQLVTNGTSSTANLVETITGTVTPGYVQAVDSDCVYGEPHCGDQGDGPNGTGNSTFNGFTGHQASQFQFLGNTLIADNGDFDFDYLTQGTLTLTTSVKADNPIAVSFTGSTTGSVTINSNAAVTLNGQIENPNGTTTIDTTGGGVTTTTDGLVATQNLDLNTVGGTIGTATNALVTTQTNNGTLNASGDQGVYIAATSALNIGQVSSSAGDVSLSAQGDIMRAGTPSPANVIGNNVTLTATHDGSVGTSAAPIQTAATGTVNVTADGNVAIEQTQGNLNVGTIQSVGIGGTLGNVQVAVDNGALLDAANTTQTQALSLTQQQAIWSKLKLTTETGASTLADISSAVEIDYQQYWMLLSQGTVQNGGFVLNPGAASLFQQVATEAGVTPDAYTANLYAKVVGDFVKYVGADWQSQSAFQSQVVNFSFTPSQDLITGTTTNASETEGQLLSALSVTALQPSTTGPTIGTSTPNISGGTVTLSASNGVGSLAAPVTITLSDLTSGNLTSEQEAAIALAKNPGAILFTGVNAQDQTVEFSGTVPAGVTVTGVSIGQTAPLFVQAGGTFDASAPQGGVFAQQTAGDLSIGSVNAQSGQVNLTAPGSILAANAGSTPIITGSNITLLAGDSLGSATAPLVYTGPSGTVLSSATAGQDIYLVASGIDMLVGRISGGGTVSLDAPDGSIEPTLAGIALDADNLTLTAADNIGSSTQAFEVQLATGGQLNATAGGAADVTGVGDLDVGTFTAAGDLEVTAFGNLVASDLTSTGGSVSAAAGLDNTLTDVGAKTDTTLTAVGDLTLADVTSGGDMTLASGGALSLDANGALTSGGNLTVTQASSFVMGAGSTMSVADALSLTTTGDAALMTVTTGGDATINAGGDTTIGTLTTGGTADIVSGGALALTSLTSASDMILSASGPLTLAANGLLKSGGDLTVTQASSFTMGAGSTMSVADALSLTTSGDATLTAVTTGGDATINAGGNVTIDPLTSGGAISITAGGSLSTGSLTSGNGMTLAATGPVAVTNGSSLTSGGAFSLTASELTMGLNALVSAADQIAIDVQGNAILGKLESAFNGDHAISVIAGMITGNGDGQTNIVDLSLDAKTYLAAQTGIGTSSQPIVVDTPWLAPSTVSGGIYIHDLMSLTTPDISAPTDLQIASDGDLTLGNVTAGGSATLTAAGNLLFATLAAKDDATLSAGNAITATSIAAGDTASITVGPGSLNVGTLTAANLIISSPVALDLPSLTIANNVTLEAPEITATLVQKGSSAPLVMNVTGLNGTPASNVSLSINAPNGVTFDDYAATDGTIVTTALDVDIVKGDVPHQMFLITPDTDLYLNDTSPTPVQDVTEQFWAPSTTFFLDQTGMDTRTNAYLINFSAGYTVTFVNPDGTSQPALPITQTAPLPLWASTWQKIYAEQDLSGISANVIPEFADEGAPNLAIFNQWVTSAGSGAAVNTGNQ